MLEHRNFVKKLVFAVETLPFNLVVSGLVSEIFGPAVFRCFLLSHARHAARHGALAARADRSADCCFTAGVCWFLAALGVFVRDLGQIIGFLLTIWFFLTPICYPEKSLPAAALPLLSKNPIFVLVRGYRAIFLEGHAPAFGPLWKLWLLSAVVLRAGTRLVLQAAQILRRYHLSLSMLARLTALLVSYGPLGVLLLAFIDSAGIPVASGMDALLILVAVEAPSRAYFTASLGVLGSLIGNLVLFMAARKGARRFVKEVPHPGPRRFRDWFERYGLLTIFIPAVMPIPLPLKVFVISAGVAQHRSGPSSRSS